MNKSAGRWRRQPTPAAFAVLSELLGRRWALRVIWELRGGALTFRALQAACGQISPSVLQTRIHDLSRLGVIEKIPRLGYRLSASGEQLFLNLESLCDWAASSEVAPKVK
ncbi:MAG: helix-turn-helix domain-containing protein [Woeseia sp.]